MGKNIWRNRQRAAENCRGGYVLMMTLIVLALMILLLTGIARRSLGVALESLLEESELQDRWRSISCQHAVLHHAQSLLRYDQANRIIEALRHHQGHDEDTSRWIKELKRIPNSISFELTFNGVSHQLVLADENCKINLVFMAKHQPPEQAMKIAQKLIGASQIQLRPVKQWRAGSWGHLFQSQNQDKIWPGVEQTTAQITNSGSARINQLRCNDDLFQDIVEVLLLRNKARELIDVRLEFPFLTLPEMLEKVQVSDDERILLSRWFGETSDTFSLWIRSSQQQTLEFHTIRRQGNLPVYRSYVW